MKRLLWLLRNFSFLMQIRCITLLDYENQMKRSKRTMKKSAWMLCITLLLTLLLVGCNQSVNPGTTTGTQNQSAAIDSKPDPANSTTPPIEGTATPIESTTTPLESTTTPIENTTTPSENTFDPADTDGMYMLLNGTRVELGMKYADVKEGLGAQTAPDQEIGSCDNPDFVRIVHFYPGMTVTENPDGTIWGMELSSMYAGEGDAALKGIVKLGTTLDAALAALGQPENAASIKEDCVLNYRQDGQAIYVFLDADTVSGISMTLAGK